MSSHDTDNIELVLPRTSRIREWYSSGWPLPWLVLAISLAATYLLWQNEQQNAKKDMQIDFDFRVREADTRIEQRMKAYEQILRGTRALFISSRNVSRDEFREYADSLYLKDNYPGSQSIGFALVVPEAHKAGHIAARFNGGMPPGAIQSGTDGITNTSVTFLEPLSVDTGFPLGSDMFSDPVRRAAMELARDTGQAVNSGKVLLPQDADENKLMQSGFLMYLPVYRAGRPHATLAERRTNIIGWIYASFRLIDLMTDILDEISGEVDFEIHDGDSVVDETMIYDPDLSGSLGNPGAQFKSRSRIEVANHYWTVVIRSLDAFEMRVDREKPNFVAYIGIETSLLLAVLAWLLVRGRARAVLAAEKLNLELAERKRAEEGLRLAATVVRTVEEAVLVTDANNLIVSVNPAFTAITGYSPEDVIGKNPRIFRSGKHSTEFYKELWGTLLATGSWRGEIWDRRKDGESYVKWLSIKLVRNEDGQLTHHLAVFSDISERKAAEERMQHLAHHDVLTDLPNRALFNDRLQQGIAQAKRDKTRMALMFLDLDKFKPINDTLGHAVGDLLLKEVARRLLNCVRESDTVSRIGGDEFIVLLPAINAEQDAMLVADKILHVLARPFALDGTSLNISVSIGLAMYPEHGSDERALTKNADMAMYYAKAGGRNNVKLFQSDMIKNGAH
jgi:diguanylate cyclase (GGDEF)-like protein/PAS domain S-box-containing protein